MLFSVQRLLADGPGGVARTRAYNLGGEAPNRRAWGGRGPTSQARAQRDREIAVFLSQAERFEAEMLGAAKALR